MACREDRGAVLERHAHHLGSAIGSYSHLVANGGCPEVSGRHEACIAGRTDGLNGLVVSTIDFLSVFHKVVAGNAVYGGHAAGIDAGVADGGDGWDVGQGGILASVALAEHSPESALGVAFLIAVEIVPPHLVDDDAHHELGTL